MRLITALILWSVLGGFLCLFVDAMTGSDALGLTVAGLTGLVGGWTTASIMRQPDRL